MARKVDQINANTRIVAVEHDSDWFYMYQIRLRYWLFNIPYWKTIAYREKEGAKSYSTIKDWLVLNAEKYFRRLEQKNTFDPFL